MAFAQQLPLPGCSSRTRSLAPRRGALHVCAAEKQARWGELGKPSQQQAVTNVVATPAGEVRLGSFLSGKVKVADALEEAVAAISRGLGGAPFQPDVALVFATAAYAEQLEQVVPALRRLAPSLRHVFGCTVRALLTREETASGAVASAAVFHLPQAETTRTAATFDQQSYGAVGSSNDDMEGVPGVSITLASLPGVEISVTHTLRSGIPDEGEGRAARRCRGVQGPSLVAEALADLRAGVSSHFE